MKLSTLYISYSISNLTQVCACLCAMSLSCPRMFTSINMHSLWVVSLHVLRLRFYQLQIFWSIITSILILVMYDFFYTQITTKNRFDNQPMFEHISIAVSRWVAFCKNVDISLMKVSAPFEMIRPMTNHPNCTTLSRTKLLFGPYNFDRRFAHTTWLSHMYQYCNT